VRFLGIESVTRPDMTWRRGLVLCLVAGTLAAVSVGHADARGYRPSSLSKSHAAAVVSQALRSRYGSSYRDRQAYASSCGRLTRIRVRCRVSWHTASHAYRGSVTVWTTVTSSGERSVKRRLDVRTEPLAPTHAPQSPACDPNYTGACLDPNASDYDCADGSGDGPKYTGTVTVVGDDHYGLDRDGDGIGCE
jgi:hypothetical protein